MQLGDPLHSKCEVQFSGSFEWRQAATGFGLAIENKTTGNAAVLLIRGQTTLAAGTGGRVEVRPGTGTIIDGSIQIKNAAGTDVVRVDSDGLAFFNTGGGEAQPADPGLITNTTGGTANGS